MRFLMSIAAFFLMLSNYPLQAVDYDIDMSRRAKKGDRYHVECTANEAGRYALTIDGNAEPVTNWKRSCALSADAETIAVGQGGAETHIRLLINKFVYQINDDEKKVLLAGSIVDVQWKDDDNNAKYLLDNKPVDEDVRQVFRTILFVDPPTHSLNELFAGTKSKQAVGQKWPMNGEAIAKHLSTSIKKPFDAKNVAGFSTLVEATDSELKINSEYTIQNFPANFEPWLTVTDSKLQSSAERWDPIDHHKRPRKIINRVTIISTATGGKDGAQHNCESIYRCVTNYEMTPLR